MLLRNASIEDLLISVGHRDTIVVLPTLQHAVHWWPIIKEATETRYGSWGNIISTTTAIVIGRRHTVLRLWVPYERDPTMPMDWKKNRRGFDQADLYGMMGMRKEL